MIKIIKKPVAPIDANSYTVIDTENKKCLLIDFGADFSRLMKSCDDLGLTVCGAILTHGHFDHIGAADDVKRAFPQSQIVIMKEDEDICRNPSLVGGDNVTADPDMLVSDGDVIKVAELSFKYMATPGHTKGSAIIICGDCIFSGDTLMSRTCGRTDLYGGSTKEIRASLKKIGALEGDYKIYPGHGPETNMAVERYANPYLRKAMGLGI